jgi:cytidylate kinase
MGKNFVITIARGFGSRGKEIGSELAKLYGINCYEHGILTLASQMSGIDRSLFAAADERLTKPSIMDALKGEAAITNEQLFDYQAQIIRGLAFSESCVIVGKCADYILKDLDNVFSFYIEAPRAYCLENIMRKMEVTEEEAHELITATDKRRAAYYKYYSGGNYWTNPVNYDMTLNTEKVGKENVIRIIKTYVDMRMEEK